MLPTLYPRRHWKYQRVVVSADVISRPWRLPDLQECCQEACQDCGEPNKMVIADILWAGHHSLQVMEGSQNWKRRRYLLIYEVIDLD